MKVFIAGQKHFAKEVIDLAVRKGYGITVYAPEGDKHVLDITSRHGISVIHKFDQLIDEQFDLGICAHCFEYIPEKVRDLAKVGFIGYHPSLLPRHRGKNSILAAIKSGDPIVGGSVYWLSSSFDKGEIAAQDWLWRPQNDSALDLWRLKLAPLGLQLISKVLDDIENGKIVKTPQNEEFATYC